MPSLKLPKMNGSFFCAAGVGDFLCGVTEEKLESRNHFFVVFDDHLIQTNLEKTIQKRIEEEGFRSKSPIFGFQEREI
jgi:hypothetical protein